MSEVCKDCRKFDLYWDSDNETKLTCDAEFLGVFIIFLSKVAWCDF